MAEETARLYRKWKNTLYFVSILIWYLSHSVLGDCGPLGFDAADLLSPDYWFLDLNKTECDKISWKGKLHTTDENNLTDCRLYMNLCKPMIYQCYGTVCIRHLDSSDNVFRLGVSSGDPFHEGAQMFSAVYSGEEMCPGKDVKTTIQFLCNHNASWDTKVVHAHGGAKARDPVALTYDNKTCELTLAFHYSGACYSSRPGEGPGHSISVGSIILILFFPGILLYFIVGILINRMAGRTGTDMIPHSKFWLDLPDLIMEGFIFSMGVLTCRKGEQRMNYENM